MSAAFSTFCDSRGIKLVPTVPYTPTDNGEAERLNRTIGESARTILHSSGLPDKFWSYAYHVATYLHNRLPNKRMNEVTPVEILLGIKPSPSTLYQFCTKAIIQIPNTTQPKLSQHAYEAILIGYPESGRGWVFYLPPNTSIIHLTQDVFPNTLQAPLVKSGHPIKLSLNTLLN
ncbi:hypothetical protein O181_006136 [Austropuccinia psidii MF-1]|uniref:Integrase catalytic domain-containing protein n=1 Tax=Austropuccinia psidii MF-1 TaxID=1389203 RepID=A0A9Q3GGH4_9BASI|nr:hypothetical protein [Austropuccinia psidii MF-1]